MKTNKYKNEQSLAKLVSFSVAASPEYISWLRRLSRKTMVPYSTLARAAINEWAKAQVRDFESPPER